MNTEYIKNLDIWKFFIYFVNTVINPDATVIWTYEDNYVIFSGLVHQAFTNSALHEHPQCREIGPQSVEI